MKTTPSLSLYSEPYSSTGNIGQNFRRLLGAPSLDPLQTVIREAVQNIADAAVEASGPGILIRIRRLAPEQRKTLENHIFATLPENSESAGQIRKSIRSEFLTVLEVCDFGTSGLGGPTRSDQVPIDTTRTDFIDFMRNIGSARDTTQGGGTYGFGKVALYRASACSTIIVDTLPQDATEHGRRLMACHVGPSFQVPDSSGTMQRRFTGRHWWGSLDPDDCIADPLTGAGASELADALGFPDRGNGQSGTSIMILDFQSDKADLQLAARQVTEILLWNFWPRLMKDAPGNKKFDCRVMADDQEILVPDPDSIAPFNLLCKAMRTALSGTRGGARPIRSLRPAKHLGTFAMETGLRSPREHLVPDADRLVPNLLHHIALMRPVHLVVKYLEGKPHMQDELEWAGVFIASDEEEVEEAFANSEPPAHDNWVPDNLPKGRQKSYVNIALRELGKIANEPGETGILSHTDDGSSPPLARLAGRLGTFLDDVGNDARRRIPRNQPRQTNRPPRATASRPQFTRLEGSAARRIAVFTTRVIQDAHKTGAVLAASASVFVEGARPLRSEEAAPVPEVIRIQRSDGQSFRHGSRYPLLRQGGLFEIHVLVPEQCAVIVEAQVQSGVTP